jgi:hypothetical protein
MPGIIGAPAGVEETGDGALGAAGAGVALLEAAGRRQNDAQQGDPLK